MIPLSRVTVPPLSFAVTAAPPGVMAPATFLPVAGVQPRVMPGYSVPWVMQIPELLTTPELLEPPELEALPPLEPVPLLGALPLLDAPPLLEALPLLDGLPLLEVETPLLPPLEPLASALPTAEESDPQAAISAATAAHPAIRWGELVQPRATLRAFALVTIVVYVLSHLSGSLRSEAGPHQREAGRAGWQCVPPVAPRFLGSDGVRLWPAMSPFVRNNIGAPRCRAQLPCRT